MALFLLRFWPVLVPLIAYIAWMMSVRNKARKAGDPLPRFFKDGPWFWTLVCSLSIAIVIFIFFGLNIEGGKGEYIPPHMENGKIVPGQVQP